MWTSAAASARVIWRDAGRAVKGSGTSPERSAIQARTCGQARAALARSEAGETGPLDELELLEALVPGALQAIHRDLVAAADDPLRRGGRQRMLVGGVAHDCHRDRSGHPREHVPRRQAQAEDRRVAGRRRLGTGRRIGGHDRADVTGLVALEPDEPAIQALARHAGRRRPEGYGSTQVHAGRVESLGSAGGDQARQVVARADRVDLGGARRHDDLVRMDVEHAAPRSRATMVGPA